MLTWTIDTPILMNSIIPRLERESGSDNLKSEKEDALFRGSVTIDQEDPTDEIMVDRLEQIRKQQRFEEHRLKEQARFQLLYNARKAKKLQTPRYNMVWKSALVKEVEDIEQGQVREIKKQKSWIQSIRTSLASIVADEWYCLLC